ncbi:hypothetical protein TNCV_4173881 [Trichonephila clavipes]|nr:hypothetical protein TNCV_4173881 [Trichonephila clavipes]
MTIGIRLAKASVSSTTNTGRFQDQCVKGYYILHKPGELSPRSVSSSTTRDGPAGANSLFLLISEYGSYSSTSRNHSERVNINVAMLSYKRAFGDGPRNFEPRSSDEDDT